MSRERISKRQPLLLRIAEALERIADTMERGGAEEMPPPIDVNDSMGSCPSCGSLNTKQFGDYPKAVYQCQDCEHAWANQEIFEGQ